MADEKKVKFKIKVKSKGKIPAEIDVALNEMAKLFINKPVAGEMDYLIKKKNGEIVIDEFLMSESLIAASGYKDLGAIIQKSAHADLASVTDGRITVLFETEFEHLTA